MPHDEVPQFQRIRAKRLRREMTRAETLLWRYLKADRLAGLAFRRQTPMCNCIADFVAHSLEAAEQAAPLSLTLPRKGGGNPSSDASLTDDKSGASPGVEEA
ncbi:DUF559 domain-containing protein [Bradyrhizobium sp. I71]|uniref:DUF559 domain-containing protein n=1 Tax=Bradyrhizobium sp. I71 TaxID=2590772 RepID=UPI0031F71A0F